MTKYYKTISFFTILTLTISCSQQNQTCLENYNQAKKQIDLKNYDNAISLLKKQAKECSSDSVLFQIGFCYMRKLQWDTAIYYTKKTLEINPNYPLAISNLASLYSFNDSTCEKALGLMLKLDSIKPNFDYQITMAKIYNCLKKYGKEIDCLDNVISKNPGDIDNYKTRAMAYWNNNQQEKAIEDFDVIIKADPNNAEILHNRAMAKIDIGKTKDACIDLMKAKKLSYKQSEIAYKQNCKCIPEKKKRKNTIRKLRIS